MIEISNLLQLLNVNGVTKDSSLESVRSTLALLKYTPEEIQQSIDLLKTQGWALVSTPMPTPMPVTPPAPIVQPQPVTAPVAQFVQNPIVAPVIAHGKKNFIPYVVVIAVLLVAGGGIALAAKYQLLPFLNTAAYTPENFSSSLLSKVANIKSVAYKASFSLNVVNREKDAVPFAVTVTNTAELREKYQNDSDRARDISSIISLLRSYSYSNNKKTSGETYPASLQKLVTDMTKVSSYYKNTNLIDSATNKAYDYQVVDGGNNFNLVATFETDDAINAIRNSYGYIATTTIINNKTVTFTKNSIYYFYVPTEPPKPLLIQLGESMRQLPADVNVIFDAGAQANITDDLASSNWLAQFNAEGSFGDLSYKVNAEARKKDSNYYLRINNIPSIVGSYSSLKGQWIKISTDVSTSTNKNSYNQLNYISTEIQSAEKTYKENRALMAKILQKAASIADQEKIISFKSSPKKDTVDGRDLTKYEIQIRKEAILPFYQKFVSEVNSDPSLKKYKLASEEGLVQYLQSSEFSQVFDYINKNTNFTMWVDAQGYPAIIQEGMRVVPPDTATQLKNKQVNVLFKLALSEINKTVDVQVPSGARPIEQVMSDLEKNMYGYDVSGEAKIKSSLSTLRAGAEIVSSNSKTSSYGVSPFTLGACKQTAGTLFGDKTVFGLINDATNNNPSKATCVSKGTTNKVDSWAISAPLVSDSTYSWCVDSTGNSKQIRGSIKSSVCK